MATEPFVDRPRVTDYETVFILRADIDADTSEKVISRAVSAIEATGGKLTKVESWGKRRLAFPIAKQKKGFYVYLRYVGKQGTVAELERNLRMLDPVIRHMSVALAKGIDAATVVIDPEEVKVRRIEVTAEEEEREESFEASLGLVDDNRMSAHAAAAAAATAPEPTPSEPPTAPEAATNGAEPTPAAEA